MAEGWLKLSIAPVKVLSFWVRDGVEAVVRDSCIRLAWSLQGAETLQLEEVHAGGTPVVIEKWEKPPLPRECSVTVKARTVYRLTACARDSAPSMRDLAINMIE